MRVFTNHSTVANGHLHVSLAPALTPHGIEFHPHFFTGTLVHPQIFARSLLVLADISATRYFKYVPVPERDPILTAQGDRLRAECFSACNSVYARLDLFASGLNGTIDYGTTNIDIGPQFRNALTAIKQDDELQITIGDEGLTAVSNEQAKLEEKPVNMPERWIRALGNASQIHTEMKAVFTLNQIYAQMFLTTLPHATGSNQSGWISNSLSGAKISPRKSPNSVYVSGLHRLSSLKRVLTEVKAMTFYAPSDDNPGHFMVDVDLDTARITISLTAESWQGYSGEGSLLESLADNQLIADAQVVSNQLKFGAIIDQLKIAKSSGLDLKRINAALTYLAVSGKLGYDVRERSYFHRELPSDSSRVLKDNPRLVGAQKIMDKVTHIDNQTWLVNNEYRVTYDQDSDLSSAKCTCPWYLRYTNSRGPCKHILAVKLQEETDE